MSPTHRPSPEEALTRLLQSLFDVGGLRRFLRGAEDTRVVVDHIPGESAPLATVAFETAEELLRRGLARSAFFDRLAHEFPHRQADIDEVRQHLGVESPTHQVTVSPARAMPPRTIARPSPTTPDRQVVDTFAELYPSPQEARGVWQRAGGRVGDVPHGSGRPRDLWWELWRLSLLGGPARPEALLNEALRDAPDNPTLRQSLANLTGTRKDEDV